MTGFREEQEWSNEMIRDLLAEDEPCDLCWATFPDADELAKHVQMEEAVDWPIQTEEPADA